MTEDVAFYVELAREADGPLVELAVGNGRVAIPVAQATGRPVIGIDTSPAMLEQARDERGRGRRRARAARRRHARARARRAGGADLLPVPRAAASADVGRPAPHVRARRCVAPARAAGSRGTRSRSTTRSPSGSTASTSDEPVPHTVRYAVGDNRIDITLDDGATSSLWWATKNEWLGLIDVAGPRARGALRRLRRRAVRRRQPRVRLRRAPLRRARPVRLCPGAARVLRRAPPAPSR